MSKIVRMTRPSEEGRTKFVRIKVTPTEMRALDQWCDAQRFPPSRAEAMRRIAMQVVMTENQRKQS
jgi:hypothetical protein